MAYVFPLIAISEAAANSLPKSRHDFAGLLPSFTIVPGYCIDFLALSQAVRGMTIGYAHALR